LRGDFALLLTDADSNGSVVQYFPISDFQTTGATVTLPTSVAPGFVQLLGHDVNGDGLTDLVIPNESAGTLQFLITTSPINQPQPISVAAGQASGSLTLYYDVVAPLQFSGTVYNDTNGNSQQDAGEAGVSGVDVFLDLNGDGVFQSGLEPKAKTDSNGYYVFSAEHTILTLNTPYPVAYTVSGDIGLTQAGPGPFLEYTATITNPFTPPSGLDFGQVASARITGTVSGYDYGAGSGSEAAPLAGWTIQLFSGSQLIRTTLTDASGNYTFEGLLPGAYTVHQVVPSGWHQVSPQGTSALSGTVQSIPLRETEQGASYSVSPTGVTAGDFDNDGFVDIAYIGSTFGISILFGSATGFSTTPLTLFVDGSQPIKVLAVNFFQRGLLDIAVLDSQNEINLLKNLGGRQFANAQFLNLQSQLFEHATDMVAGDFDNDGLDDLALGAPGSQNAFAVVLAKDQSVHVTYGPQFEGPNGAKMRLSVGDMNSDGNLDLIGYDQSSLQFNLLLGDGAGGFTVTTPSIPSPFSTQSTYMLGAPVAVGNFNPGQGLQVAIGWAYAQPWDPAYIGFAIATLSDDGTWTTTNGVLGSYITSTNAYPPNGQLTGIPDAIAADFNADGRPDLITLQLGLGSTDEFDPNDGVTGVQIFLDGRGFPGQPTLLALLDAYVDPFGGTLRGPEQLVAADVNGDGLLDLIIPNYNSAELEILINTSIFSSTDYDVEITSTKNVGDINFTNVSFASITGSVSADSNRNGRLEPADTGRAGVQVYLDLNHNGQFDSGESTAMTNSAGLFAFRGLADGTYDVRLASESGWVLTTVGNGAVQAQVGAGQTPYLEFATAPRLFTAVDNQSVSEEQVLNVALGLSSTTAGRHMTFQLVNPPAGATIDAGTGHFTWTPALAQSPGATTITVRTFDLFDPTFQDTISFQVQVNAVPSTEHFLNDLYQHLLHRSPDAAGLASWTAVLNGGAARSLVVSLFWTSTEHRGVQVDDYYTNYLHRAADAEGRESWIAALQAGTPEAEVQFKFLNSAEYAARWNNDQEFVSGLYQDVLHRAADSVGAAFWEGVAGTTDGRGQVVAGLLGSAERFRNDTDLLYRDLLARPASTDDLAYWLTQIEQHEADLPAIEQFVLSSDEFYQRT
jgi:hypothetical protein